MNSLIQEENVVKEDKPGANHIACQATGSNSGDSLDEKVKQIEEEELGGRKDLPFTVSGSEIQSRGQDSPIGKYVNCSQANHRKRAIWELARPAAENQKVELSNDSLCEGSPSKKPKTENESSSSLSRDNDSGIMKKSPEVVFPLDLNAEREDMEMVDDLIPLCNNDNKRQLSGTVPNLELALGAEETSQDTMGLLPFLAGRRNNSGEQSSSDSMMNKEKKKEEDDDDVADAGSLSLSLSFPGEERKNVNTPMFLFRDLTR